MGILVLYVFEVVVIFFLVCRLFWVIVVIGRFSVRSRVRIRLWCIRIFIGLMNLGELLFEYGFCVNVVC